MKQTVSEQALALVEKKLPNVKGALTPQDAATATGITVGEAREALARLMELYVTRVTNDDQGNVLFAFEMPLRRRGTKTAAEKWAETKDALWRGFKVFFKVWIGLMVVVYFVIMVLILLAIMFAQQSDRSDRRRGRGGDDMFGGLLRVFAEGMRFAFWTNMMSPMGYSYGYDNYGYRYRTVQTPRASGSDEKSFIIAIYDLALGPERLAPDPLENEQEVAAFLRSEKGVLTPSEIVGLSGGSIADAEERMADYLVRFNGEPTITEDGVVVGEFEEFVGGVASETDGKITPFWEEFEAPYEHSGNSSGRNTAIFAMVGFTMLMGFLIMGGLLQRVPRLPVFLHGGAITFVLGVFPVIFSISYIAVAAIRYGIMKKKEAERLERNREKVVMRAIFQGHLWRTTPDEVYFTLLSYGNKDVTQQQTATILQKILPSLQGDIELDEQGNPIYVFERLQREYEAAAKLRGRPAKTLG